MVGTVAILIVPVTLQIIARYTALIPSWIWTEEASRFLFIWMVMLGAMIGVRERSHFDVDVWPELSPRGQAALRLSASLGMLALALVFIWAGWQFTRFAWNRVSELAELPLGLIHMACALAGVSGALLLGHDL